MKSSSSTNKITETRICRFFNLFSKMWKTNNKYNANKIGERAEPWPTPTSTLKKGEEKLFQTLSKINGSNWWVRNGKTAQCWMSKY